jgi:endo-1,4-beta-xylanase
MKLSQIFRTAAPLALAACAAPALVAQSIPEPLSVPAPGPQTDAAYAPTAILPGGIVMPLYPPDSPYLNKERIAEPEKYNMTNGTPGRIQSIVNIHNPSIEIHTVGGNRNTGSAIILAAGGGHRTLNVGTESADFWPFFYNYGVSVIILRNRLRSDGYEPTTDAVRDALQAVRLVRKNAEAFGIDPNKIGIMGFSAGAELSSPAAVFYKKFDEENNNPSDQLAGVSSRPDWAGVIYPGPTPFARGQSPEIPKNAPPSFIATSGSGDQIHAIWAMEYFDAMLKLGVPNIEMHIYGNGPHAGGLTDRNGTPFGTWQMRFIDWFRDLGFLQPPGVVTKAATDTEAFVNAPPRPARRGPGGPGGGRGPGQGRPPPAPGN